MSTPPIQLPITATDLTGPAFTSAATKAQAFQASMNATGYSMREARGAAMLLGEEIGVKLNRHLAGFLVNIPAIGSAMAGAFSVVAIVGFLEVAQQIPETIDKAWQSLSGLKAEDALIEAQSKVEESLHKIAEATAKAQAAYDRMGKSSQQVALMDQLDATAEQKSAQGRLALLQAQLKAQEEIAKQTRAVALGKGGASSRESTEDAVTAQAGIPALKTQIKLLQEGMKELGIKGAMAGWKFGDAMTKGFDEATKKAAQFRKTFEEVGAAVEKASNRYKFHNETLADLMPIGEPGKGYPDLGGYSQPQAPIYSGNKEAMDLYKVQSDQNAAIQAAQQIYEETRTKAQVYSDTIAGLTELLNQNRISHEQFATAAMQAGEKMDKHSQAWKQFSDEVGRNVSQAALFGRSWSDAFKACLVDLSKLVLQMYVFDSLSKHFGGATGGILGKVFSGLAGAKAGGGPVYGGMSYLVGESGPELFTPGASGSITPNGGFGGGTVVQNFDFRGADPGSEQRLRMMLQAVEARAVAKAVTTVQERDLRRPWTR